MLIDPAINIGPFKPSRPGYGPVLSYLQAAQLTTPLKIHPLLQCRTWDPKPYAKYLAWNCIEVGDGRLQACQSGALRCQTEQGSTRCLRLSGSTMMIPKPSVPVLRLGLGGRGSLTIAGMCVFAPASSGLSQLMRDTQGLKNAVNRLLHQSWKRSTWGTSSRAGRYV